MCAPGDRNGRPGAEAVGPDSAPQRSDILRRAFDLIMARQDEPALTTTTEMGKPAAEAKEFPLTRNRKIGSAIAAGCAKVFEPANLTAPSSPALAAS